MHSGAHASGTLKISCSALLLQLSSKAQHTTNNENASAKLDDTVSSSGTPLQQATDCGYMLCQFDHGVSSSGKTSLAEQDRKLECVIRDGGYCSETSSYISSDDMDLWSLKPGSPLVNSSGLDTAGESSLESSGRCTESSDAEYSAAGAQQKCHDTDQMLEHSETESTIISKNISETLVDTFDKVVPVGSGKATLISNALAKAGKFTEAASLTSNSNTNKMDFIVQRMSSHKLDLENFNPKYNNHVFTASTETNLVPGFSVKSIVDHLPSNGTHVDTVGNVDCWSDNQSIEALCFEENSSSENCFGNDVSMLKTLDVDGSRAEKGDDSSCSLKQLSFEVDEVRNT